MQNKSSVIVRGLCAGVITVWLMGCGGGGGGGNENPTPPQLAPETLAGKSITVAENNFPIRVWSFTENLTWDEFSNGALTRSGTYQYSKASSTATLLLRDNLNTNETINVNLTFTSLTAGNYTYTTTPTHTSGAGTFSNFSTTPPPPSGNPPGGDPGGNTGLAPTTISGRTMIGTRTQTSTGPAGQTHTYTFTGNTFTDVDNDERGTGFYTWAPNGNEANLVLNYTGSSGPRDLRGDEHALAMTFTTTNRGTFRSSYRSGNEVILINGTFEFQ